jgi:hypothetical protein
MTKNIYIKLRYCLNVTSTGGAVEELEAADPEDVGLLPACAL